MSERPYATLSYAVRDGVATVALDRPEAKNAFSLAMMTDLLAVFDAIDADDTVRAVILTGKGSVFCAGADLNEGFGFGGGEGDAFRDRGGRVSLRIRDCTKPVIGVINGAAAGAGATILLACDLRIAAPEARLLFPYVRIGMTPEGCVSWYLPRLVGVARATEWVLWGRTIGAEEALGAGLVSAVLPLEEALALAQTRGAEINATSPVAVALARRLMWTGAATGDPHEMHLAESRHVGRRRHSADVKEGVAAFREKRAAVFPQSVSRDLDAETHA